MVAAHLIQYMTVEWVGADGQTIRQEHGDVVVEEQNIVDNRVTRSVFFNSLRMAHGGNYVCRAKLTLPGSAGVFQSIQEYRLSVLSETTLYLVIPLSHCFYRYDIHSTKIWPSSPLFQVVRRQGKIALLIILIHKFVFYFVSICPDTWSWT